MRTVKILWEEVEIFFNPQEEDQVILYSPVEGIAFSPNMASLAILQAKVDALLYQ